MDNTSDTDLAAKLRKHAADAELSPVKSLLEKIIEHRQVIFELRDIGHSARQICEWLANEGVHMNDGTLRNYIARITAAEHRARDDGIVTPCDADILGICQIIEREKAARLKAGKARKTTLLTTRPERTPPAAASGLRQHPFSPTLPALRADQDL